MSHALDPDPRSRQPWLHELAIVVDGNGTALSTADGDLDGHGASGFLVDDSRVLSRLVVGLGDEPVSPVGWSAAGAGAEFVGSARGIGDAGADPVVEVHRRRLLEGGTLHETLTVTSRGPEPLEAVLRVGLAGDGADIALVKQGLATGLAAPARVDGALLCWTCPRHEVVASFDPAPASLAAADDGGGEATWTLTLRPGEPAVVRVTVTAGRSAASLFDADAGSSALAWADEVRVEAGDPRLPVVVDRSLHDLRHLLLRDPEAPEDVFCAAGTPWFLTLFGRDAVWAARMALPLGTDLAAGTLRALARRQGTRHDPATAEEPGKIPHELRRTTYEGSGFILPPVYYGTVDATALWVCLLHDAWRWGLPTDDVRGLLPALRAALTWLTDVAPGEDGLLRYVDTSGHGLANQGWKDSGDSMRHRDGRVAEAPIALVEAQAYAVEAARGAADLLDALGEDGDAGRPEALRAYADDLAQRLRDRFWVDGPDGPYLAMALDGRGEPVTGVGSNMGHALGTGALNDAEAARVAAVLTGPTMLLPHGVATLATDNGGFNPLGYHTGSVWSHDTAICALGLAREGFTGDAADLARRLLAAGAAFDGRYPELFGDGLVLDRPVPYPASCRPQAWAAASAVALLTVALGLEVDAPGRTVRLRPPADPPFGAVRVAGLSVGGAPVTVTVGADGGSSVDGLPDGWTLET